MRGFRFGGTVASALVGAIVAAILCSVRIKGGSFVETCFLAGKLIISTKRTNTRKYKISLTGEKNDTGATFLVFVILFI